MPVTFSQTMILKLLLFILQVHVEFVLADINVYIYVWWLSQTRPQCNWSLYCLLCAVALNFYLYLCQCVHIARNAEHCNSQRDFVCLSIMS